MCSNDSCKKEFEAIDEGKRTRKYCCVSCSCVGSRRVQRPSEQELTRLVETTPMIHIGKKYGVSNNAVKKWAKQYGIKLQKKHENEKTKRSPIEVPIV